MQAQPESERISFVDTARFYTMALVFYGHFIERIMYLKNPTAAAHYKFIYSFHMVLFFVLAGYVFPEHHLQMGFSRYLRHRVLSRLLPFGFFTAVFMTSAAVFPGDFFNLQLPSLAGYRDGLISTLFGVPLFCVPSWFLLIIFSVEIIHYFASRLLSSDHKVLMAALVFYAAGYWINWHFDLVNPLKGRLVGWNYLFIHEALPMYGFYLVGVYLGRSRIVAKAATAKILLPGALVAFLFVLVTYRLNTGYFSFSTFDAVVIIFSSHGHFLLFPLTALAGSLCVLFIARIAPMQKTMVWMGQNTLILMCLNGIFYHYINPPAAKWVTENLSGAPWVIFGLGCAMTAASLMACIPLIRFFSYWVPQLVGKPGRKGPLLPNFI